MSAIDSIPHVRIGRLGRVPIYLCLADSPWLGAAGDEEELSTHAGKNSICVGGGSGEHPAIVLPDPASAVRAYVEYVTGEGDFVSESPKLVFCDRMSAEDWKKEFEHEIHGSLEFPLWLALCLGEFLFFMLPDMSPAVAEVHEASAKLLAEAEPFFCMVTIPWDAYRGNGGDYFRVTKKKSMKRILSLQFADIFRDGGSYEAGFVTEDGMRFVIYLETYPKSPVRGSLRHGRLFTYTGDEMPEDAVPLPKDGKEERELVQELEAFLQAPTFSPELRDPSRALQRLTEMTGYIPLRKKA